MIVSLTKRRLQKLGTFAASSAVLAAGLAFGAVSPAAADTNNDIAVSVTEEMTRVDQNHNPQNGALTLNSAAMMKFTWDASNANPKPGDSFYIELPEALINRGVGAADEQHRDLIFNDEKVGDCLVQQKKLPALLVSKFAVNAMFTVKVVL